MNARRWAHALMAEPTPLTRFANLDVPVLLMTGARSTASAHGVARRLMSVPLRAEHVVFEHLGRRGPNTHPEPVNETVAVFRQRHT